MIKNIYGGDKMTIGDKIRYFREKRGITQKRLAELTGIHPVSIRKYETNKMQPQLAQIEKLADALGISFNALSGFDNTGLHLETVGDLMSLIIMLFNSQVITFTGERDENDLLKSDTISVQINPILSSWIKVEVSDSINKRNPVKLCDIQFKICSTKIFSDLLKWEQINYQYNKNIKIYGNNHDQSIKTLLEKWKFEKEVIELELQSSSVYLDTSHGITVRM